MTMHDGPRPDCIIAGNTSTVFCGCHTEHNRTNTYQPMGKMGSIILATSGDPGDTSRGRFYEGVMVTGTTTDATDEAVQANTVAVGHRNIPGPAPGPTSTPPGPPGPPTVSLASTSAKGRCLVPLADNMQSGVELVACNDPRASKWTITKSQVAVTGGKSGTITLSSGVCTGLCVAVVDGAAQLATCAHGNAMQEFVVSSLKSPEAPRGSRVPQTEHTTYAPSLLPIK